MAQNDKRFLREACQLLLGSEGWRALLAHILDELGHLDRAIYEVATPEAARQQYLGQHKALVALVQWVCRQGGAQDVFAQARGVFWGRMGGEPPGQAPTRPAAERCEALTDAERAEFLAHWKQQRQRGGSGLA